MYTYSQINYWKGLAPVPKMLALYVVHKHLSRKTPVLEVLHFDDYTHVIVVLNSAGSNEVNDL